MHDIAAPERRSRDIPPLEARSLCRDPREQSRTIGQRLGLTRGPGADLRFPIARGEIGIAAVAAGCRHRSLDPQLSAKAGPKQAESGVGTVGEVARLAAGAVGEE